MVFRKLRPLLLALMFVLALGCASALAEASVSGSAFLDTDGNGLLTTGEQLMTGAPIRLEKKTDTGWETVADSQTDLYGAYAFTGLEAGQYRLVCILRNYTLYASHLGGGQGATEEGLLCSDILSLSDGDSVQGMDIALGQSASLSLTAYQDANGDGEKGKYEKALSGVTARLLMDGEAAAEASTDKDGNAVLYAAPGQYTLQIALPQGYVLSASGSQNSFDGQDQKTSGMDVSLEGQTLYAAARQVGSLSGMVFEDMNNNGVLDEGEPGVEGVVLHIEGKKTGISRDEASDADGLYCFENLPDDTYTITARLPEGMLFARYSKTGGDLRSIFSGSTRERQYSVKKAAQVTDKNVGLVQRGAIRGQAFLDLNYNGLLDEGEPGYAGVTVEAIKLSNGESMGKTVTGEDGSFVIENLRGGDYRLRAILPEDGSIFTVTGEGTADTVNLFQQKNTRRESSIQPLSIVSGGEASALIGVAQGAVITGTVFEDADYSGVKNGKEKALSGIKVYAVDGDGNIVAGDTTGNKGTYRLSGILPGEYTVQVQRKKGYGFTRLRDTQKGGNHVVALESEIGVTAPITVEMGQTYADVNAGMLPSSTVSGKLFYDANDNGLWDETEPGAVQVQLRLYSEDAEMDLTQTVSADGSYFFDGVMPGTYTLTCLLPEHYEMARTASGGNTLSTPETSKFKVTMGQGVEMELFGVVELGSYQGVAFRDSNGNGVQDAGEEALSGLRIAFSGPTEAETTTGPDGVFSLTGLRPGSYSLTVQAPENTIFSHSPDEDGVVWPAESVAAFGDFPWDALTSHTQKAVGLCAPGSIQGQIWLDEDQNGRQAVTEWLMTGLSLRLVDESTGETVAQTTTDETGFTFANVRPGQYAVQFDLPAQSSPAADESAFALTGSVMSQTGLTVSEGQQVGGLSAGLVSTTSIGGTAYLDENGQRSPVAGVTVTLLKEGQQIASAQTDETGAYRFDGLWPGQYTLVASRPQGLTFVRQDDPNYGENATVIAVSGDADGSSSAFRLDMARHQLQSDILYIKPAKVGDLAWLDENGNGLLDGDEHRLPGVTIRLVQNGQTVYETVTDAYGYYLLDNVYPGSYVLVASADASLAPTQSVEELRIISSCLTSGDGLNAQSEPFEVLSGSDNRNFDVGYVLREGMTLPEAMAQEGPGRDWTLTNTPKED